MIEHCQRCTKELTGPDPLTHRTPGKDRRYSTDPQSRSPLRVVKQSADGEPSETYYCSSRCFKALHAKPSRISRKGEPGRHQQLNLRPDKSAA